MCTPRRFSPREYWIDTDQTPHPLIAPDDLPDRPIALYEITARTLSGQFLLRPDADLTEIALGVIGRAQLMTKTFIFSHHMLSNHYSVLVGVYTVEQLADFSNRVFGQLGLRVKHLRARDHKLWARRNRAIPVEPVNAVQIDRFRYNLANSVKEHIVTHASRWPGIHTATWFCNGTPHTGLWLDGTALRDARRKDRGARLEDFQRRYTVHLAKLPCLEHLSDADYAKLVRDWADEDAAAAKAEREESRKPPKAAKAGEDPPVYRPIPEPGDPIELTRVDPATTPAFWYPTSAPLAHCTPDGDAHSAATTQPRRRRRKGEPETEEQRFARQVYRDAYLAYCEALRQARDRLRAGFDALGIDLSGGLLPTGWSTGARVLHDDDVPFSREDRACPD